MIIAPNRGRLGGPIFLGSLRFVKQLNRMRRQTKVELSASRFPATRVGEHVSTLKGALLRCQTTDCRLCLERALSCSRQLQLCTAAHWLYSRERNLGYMNRIYAGPFQA